jgi:hypothetical protein
MPELIFTKLGTDIMATEPVSKAYFINPSHQCVCLCVYASYRCKATALLIVSLLSVQGNSSVNTLPRQWKNYWIRHFYAVRVLSKESTWVSVCPPLVARRQHGKDVPAATKHCWRRRFLCAPNRIKGK